MSAPVYPWFAAVSGADIEQGDVLLSCPRPVASLDILEGGASAEIEVQTVTSVILTQSCDLAMRNDGKWAAPSVLLCLVRFKNELVGHPQFGKDAGWEEARRGKHVRFHVLNCCQLAAQELDFMLVDLADVFVMSVDVVRRLAEQRSPRVRLLPPYREHLAQAFARVFMRVGLPSDIPSFTAKK